MKKAFTLLELIVVLAIFSSFLVVLTLVLNNYLVKAQKNIALLDSIRRLTETADKVNNYLIRASGPANSVRIESATQVTFDIIISGQKINAAIEVVDNTRFNYRENDQVQTVTVEDVSIRFSKAGASADVDLPIKMTVTTPNPYNTSSTLSMEFVVYPPGVR
ncbi:MAG TPA: type II secretion system protein [Pseudothermotoga sp.]|nr:type II secretion system protein [Pseudothermotoga sp.]HOK82644.1 type II secretion system protein [Pseudothermotoga sp.]HPP70405.1 type II secretion system protein [Pseudothermotoga sp.]